MPKRLIAPAYLLSSFGVMVGIAYCIKPSKCEPLYKRFDSLVCKNERLNYRFEPIHHNNTQYLKYFNHCVDTFKNDHALLLTIESRNGTVYEEPSQYTSVTKECNEYALKHYLNDTDPTFSKFYSGMGLM
jgi:hypothetical protein